MRFLTGCKADATADLIYPAGPMHLLEPMELIQDLLPGQGLEILTDYDGALQDIPARCATGIRPEMAQGSVVFALGRDTREGRGALRPFVFSRASGRSKLALFLPGLAAERGGGHRSRGLT